LRGAQVIAAHGSDEQWHAVSALVQARTKLSGHGWCSVGEILRDFGLGKWIEHDLFAESVQ
jgi:hypothetical protein